MDIQIVEWVHLSIPVPSHHSLPDFESFLFRSTHSKLLRNARYRYVHRTFVIFASSLSFAVARTKANRSSPRSKPASTVKSKKRTLEEDNDHHQGWLSLSHSKHSTVILWSRCPQRWSSAAKADKSSARSRSCDQWVSSFSAACCETSGLISS